MRIEPLKIGDEEKVSEICQKCIREINAKELTSKQVKVLLDEFSVKGIILYSEKYKVYVAKNEKKKSLELEH